MPFAPQGPLPQAEYEAVYARVPRLTVEVVIASEAGVLLTRREAGPCQGLWHIPGGTVRFGEVLTAQELLGYIEYPSHLEAGLDWTVGMAFRAELAASSTGQPFARPDVMGWFSRLPDEMHDEQKPFLRTHGLAT
jgi:hypothetical protein